MSAEMIISIAIISIMAISFIAYVCYQIKTKGLRKATIDFIVEAEERFQQGENQEKLEYVLEAIYVLVPGWVRLFITKSAVTSFIQKIFDEVKVALDYREEV